MPSIIKCGAIERFWDKVDMTYSCWLWRGWTRNGYGQFRFDGKDIPAHKFAYELFQGKVPEGLILDHLCRNPSCVNPAHLDPTTNKDNIMRGNSLPAKNSKKTHCNKGHEYTEANTYYHPKEKSRECCICKKLGNDKHNAIAKHNREKSKWVQ